MFVSSLQTCVPWVDSSGGAQGQCEKKERNACCHFSAVAKCRPRRIFQRSRMSSYYNQHDDRGRPSEGRDRDRDRSHRRSPPRSDHSSYPSSSSSSRYPRDDSSSSASRASSEPPSPVIIVRNLAHELDDGEVIDHSFFPSSISHRPIQFRLSMARFGGNVLDSRIIRDKATGPTSLAAPHISLSLRRITWIRVCHVFEH